MGKGDAEELKVGMELELFLLDEDGNVVFDADKIIKLTKKISEKVYIKHECAKNMVELGARPDPNPQKTLKDMFINVENILVTAEKEGYILLPLGAYPGEFNPDMRNNISYKIKKQIFGEKRFQIAGRVCGFHYHYQLPFHIPFIQSISVLQFLDLKYVHNLLNGFNFMIALDPALNCFMQSSPFYQGEYIGKDSRTIVYRGGKILKYDKGLYSEYQEFGALQGYKYSIFDIIEMIREMFERWTKGIKGLGINIKTLSLYGSTLGTSWNPVKINKLGTLEQRGSDMNHPKNIIAATAMMKYIMKMIYEKELEITPSQIGNENPFKIDGRKLYVPEEKYLINILQVQSAYKGMESQVVYNYCLELYRLAEKAMPSKKKYLLDPLKEMLDKKMTVSDEILAFARKRGWKNGEILSKQIARDIAKQHASRLFKELVLSRKYLEDI